MIAAERMENSENNKEDPIEPNNYLVIKRPAAYISDNLKLRIIQSSFVKRKQIVNIREINAALFFCLQDNKRI